MERRYVTVDVFTGRQFGGNPLAVVLDAEGLDAEAMQRIAREFNYSETTFVLPATLPGHDARVRIFTTTQELPFAGHPNVGTAFVLARALEARGDAVPERFLFEEGAGSVPVRLLRRDGVVHGAELTAPIRFVSGDVVAAAAVARAIGLPGTAICQEPHPPRIGSAGLPFLLVRLTDQAAVDRAEIDPTALRTLLADAGDGVRSMFLYAEQAPDRLHARMLAPLDGIHEDPATGSAAAALGGLLGSLRGATAFTIAQGVRMGRPSALHVSVSENGEIRVAGDCVAVMRGVLTVDG